MVVLMYMIYNNNFFNILETDQGPEAPEEAEGRRVHTDKLIDKLHF